MALRNSAPGGCPDAIIRHLTASDIPAVLAILSESTEAAAWSEESFYQFTTDESAGWVAEKSSEKSGGKSGEGTARILGFLIGRTAADEFEILNLAVAVDFRRQGIASKLVEDALEFARVAGGRRVFLEVRASNKPAIDLYRRFGFEERGRRARYYQNPVDDALVLSQEIIATQ